MKTKTVFARAAIALYLLALAACAATHPASLNPAPGHARQIESGAGPGSVPPSAAPRD